MITRKVVSFDELIKDMGFWDSVCGMVHDECSLGDVLTDLCESELHQVYKDDRPIGFFTVDRFCDNLIEIHAFINPEDRRYSIAALKEMDDAHSEHIVTSVWGTHSHVDKILKRMGFIHSHTAHGDLLKDGKWYDINHFVKEKDNGKEEASNVYQ